MDGLARDVRFRWTLGRLKRLGLRSGLRVSESFRWTLGRLKRDEDATLLDPRFGFRWTLGRLKLGVGVVVDVSRQVSDGPLGG